LAWRLAARFSGAEDRIYNDTLSQYGALMALVTYALLWTPWRWLTAAAVAPAVLSALIAFMALRIKPREAARLWLFQLAAAAVLALGVIVARHGPGLITGAPAIAAYVARANEPSVFTSTLSAPGEIRVVWTTSGSAWLDRNGSQVQLTLAPANTSQRIFLETMEEGTAVSFEQVLGETFTSGLPEVRPGREYVFRVRTNSPVGVNFTLRGLLRASVELKPIEVPPGT
jgi:hypothetical protein